MLSNRIPARLFNTNLLFSLFLSIFLKIEMGKTAKDFFFLMWDVSTIDSYYLAYLMMPIFPFFFFFLEVLWWLFHKSVRNWNSVISKYFLISYFFPGRNIYAIFFFWHHFSASSSLTLVHWHETWQAFYTGYTILIMCPCAVSQGMDLNLNAKQVVL